MVVCGTQSGVEFNSYPVKKIFICLFGSSPQKFLYPRFLIVEFLGPEPLGSIVETGPIP